MVTLAGPSPFVPMLRGASQDVKIKRVKVAPDEHRLAPHGTLDYDCSRQDG